MNRLSTDPNTSTKQSSKRSVLASNPVLRRLNKVNEVSDVNCATYGGIALKTVYFLLFSVAGIILQVILKNTLETTGDISPINIRGFEVLISTGEIIALVAALVLGIIFQLLATFARGTTPVTGALYCVTEGYFISFLIFKVLAVYELEYLGALALAITLLIILVMALLYAKGIIRVTKKFRMVLFTLLFTMVGVSVLGVIAYFIPFTRGLMSSIYNNIGLSIAFSAIFIVIAALFLICDFDTIDHVVTDKMPKKYEWQASFGLSFTVLWLYLKVLDIIMTIAGSNRSN